MAIAPRLLFSFRPSTVGADRGRSLSNVVFCTGVNIYSISIIDSPSVLSSDVGLFSWGYHVDKESVFQRGGTPGKSSLTFIDHKMVVRHVNKAINALQN